MKSENLSYFLINPYDKTIAPVYYDGELCSLYALLQCSCVTIAGCPRYDLFVDDEGLFKPEQKCFFCFDYPSQPLAGMALVTSCDAQGNAVPPDITLEELEARIMFVESIEWEGE